VSNKLIEWNNLVARLANVNLQQEPGVFVRHLHKNGIFSINSFSIMGLKFHKKFGV